jgi:hypothetical protein
MLESISGNTTGQAAIVLVPSAPDHRPFVDPAFLPRSRSWALWVGPAISLTILVGALYQLRSLDIASVVQLVPGAPLFWLAFLACYLAQPATEWIIFRRLWGLPARGLAALLGKRVSNEILLGYLGEVYFYAWARRNAHISAAPFGAIKDVTMLSALVGNFVTLVMVVPCAGMLAAAPLGADSRPILLSIAVVLVSSTLVMTARKRLFSLPPSELRFVAALHLLRIALTTILSAYLWHLLVPTIGLHWLFALSALRQLVSRLPLVPNKDLVFAGLTATLVGSAGLLVPAMALMATLLLAAHLLVGIALGVAGLADGGRP